MDKKLLLDIINNGINEIKDITKDFQTRELSEVEINITIKKTEILLKELHLLLDYKNEIANPEIKTLQKEIIKEVQNRVIEENKEKVNEVILEKIDKKEETVIKSITKEKPTEITEEENLQKNTKDIRDLIGLNDNYLFIRELFDGDSKEYTDTINRINSANSLSEAQKITSSQSWNKEDESTQLFLELLNRKFI